MKGKNRSIHTSIIHTFLVLQVFFALYTCSLLRISNLRYRRRVLAIYHLVDGQVDSNDYMNLLLDLPDSAVEDGLQRLARLGYGDYVVNQIRLWKGTEVLLALAGIGVLAVGVFLLYYLMYYRGWKKDHTYIECVTKGVMSGEVETKECFYRENQEVVDHLYRIGTWNRKKEIDLQKERLEVMEILENVAHQMKTPLAGVQMYLEVLTQSEENPARKKKLDMCHQSVEALEQMVFHILRMARLDSGRVTFQLEQGSLQDIWAKACRNNQYLMSRKSMDVKLEGDTDMTVCCDLFWTEEALTNVINNALAYSDPRGTVRGILQESEHELELCIFNEGPRIPQEEYDKIFERFFHRGKENGGDGIGLHMARKVMQMQGGTLNLRPVEGGNCFALVFHEALGKGKKNRYE